MQELEFEDDSITESDLAIMAENSLRYREMREVRRAFLTIFYKERGIQLIMMKKFLDEHPQCPRCQQDFSLQVNQYQVLECLCGARVHNGMFSCTIGNYLCDWNLVDKIFRVLPDYKELPYVSPNKTWLSLPYIKFTTTEEQLKTLLVFS